MIPQPAAGTGGLPESSQSDFEYGLTQPSDTAVEGKYTHLSPLTTVT
jgi:hypothetical protein